MKPPTDLSRLRSFFDSVNWPKLELEVAGEARTRIVIVGPVNSGKSTLFNQLKGRMVSEVSAVPGTTKASVAEAFGPFMLVDTPGFSEAAGDERARLARAEIEKAELIVLLLDGAAEVRQADLDLYADLRAAGAPVVVALNKIDLVRRDLNAILDDLVYRLQGVTAIPISARTGAGIAERLIPALLESSEAIAVVIGRALPEFREKATRRVINTTALWGLLLGTEPIPGLDLPVLLGMQARMILRIAAIYGESFSTHHARELAATVASSLLTRYLGMELAKLLPVAGWMVSGIMAGLSTLGMGRAAEAYFKSGRRLSLGQVRELAQRLIPRPRPFPQVELPPRGAETENPPPSNPGDENAEY